MPALDFAALRAPFLPTDLEWRIGQAGVKDTGEPWAKAFAYVTARAIHDRLDALVGPARWRNRVRPVVLGDVRGFVCGLALRLGEGADAEWVTKWDGADLSETEPFKGGLSGAFKRCAVLWGIGRYLYDLPEGWVQISDRGRFYAKTKVKIKATGQEEWISFKWDPPALPAWALPDVTPTAAPARAPATPAPAAVATPTLTDISAAHATAAAYGNAEDRSGVARPSALALESAYPEGVEVYPSADPPSRKQVDFFLNLIASSVFTADEQGRARAWLATAATRTTMRPYLDQIKDTIARRKAEAPV